MGIKLKPHAIQKNVLTGSYGQFTVEIEPVGEDDRYYVMVHLTRSPHIGASLAAALGEGELSDDRRGGYRDLTDKQYDQLDRLSEELDGYY